MRPIVVLDYGRSAEAGWRRWDVDTVLASICAAVLAAVSAMVVAAIVWLVIVVTTADRERFNRARASAAQTDLANFATALDAFRADVGRFPAPREGLGALMTCPA